MPKFIPVKKGDNPQVGGFLDSKVINSVFELLNAIQTARVVVAPTTDVETAVTFDKKGMVITVPSGGTEGLGAIKGDIATIRTLKDQVNLIWQCLSKISPTANEGIPSWIRDEIDALKSRLDAIDTGISGGGGFAGVEGSVDKGISDLFKDTANDPLWRKLGLDPDHMRTLSPAEQIQEVVKALVNSSDAWVDAYNMLIATIGKIQLELEGMNGSRLAEALARIEFLLSDYVYHTITGSIGVEWNSLAAADDKVDYVLKNTNVSDGPLWVGFWDSETLAEYMNDFVGLKSPPKGLVRTVYDLLDGVKVNTTDIGNLQQENQDRVDEITALDARVEDAETTITNLSNASLAALITDTANDSIWSGYGLTGSTLRGMSAPAQVVAVFTAISTKLEAHNALIAKVSKIEDFLSHLDEKIVAEPVSLTFNTSTGTGSGDAPITVTKYVP